MDEVEKSAESVEEAVEAALAELGISEQEAAIEIVQEPRGGFLGVGSHPAVVRVRRQAAQAVPDASVRETQAEVGADFIEGLLEVMGFQADVEVNEVEGVMYVDVWAQDGGDDMGALIGRGGHTLEAVQELLRSRVQAETGDRCEVFVDVEDYRKRRGEVLQRKARELARRVRTTGKSKALEPMRAAERKVVHDALADFGGVRTESQGEEPERRVVIHPREGSGVSRETRGPAGGSPRRTRHAPQ